MFDDMRKVVRSGKSYDVVIYAGHGPLLDAWCPASIRAQTVQQSATEERHIVIDDGGFSTIGSVRFSVPLGYESYQDCTQKR